MKYDRKWRGGKEPGPKVSVKIESDTESEPVITDNSAPLKIAEELEGKIFPPRRRRKSSGSTSATKADVWSVESWDQAIWFQATTAHVSSDDVLSKCKQ